MNVSRYMDMTRKVKILRDYLLLKKFVKIRMKEQGKAGMI